MVKCFECGKDIAVGRVKHYVLEENGKVIGRIHKGCKKGKNPIGKMPKIVPKERYAIEEKEIYAPPKAYMTYAMKKIVPKVKPKDPKAFVSWMWWYGLTPASRAKWEKLRKEDEENPISVSKIIRNIQMHLGSYFIGVDIERPKKELDFLLAMASGGFNTLTSREMREFRNNFPNIFELLTVVPADWDKIIAGKGNVIRDELRRMIIKEENPEENIRRARRGRIFTREIKQIAKIIDRTFLKPFKHTAKDVEVELIGENPRHLFLRMCYKVAPPPQFKECMYIVLRKKPIEMIHWFVDEQKFFEEYHWSGRHTVNWYVDLPKRRKKGGEGNPEKSGSEMGDN